MVIIKKIGQIN
jgi:hypothetical protein